MAEKPQHENHQGVTKGTRKEKKAISFVGFVPIFVSFVLNAL